MGVPAFFRWLSRKYPVIINDAVEERKTDANGERVPADASQPNPNYQEFDNLYLDMNAIIHPCTHPEDRPAPKTEEEMFVLIFRHIDRLFSIVRPRRVLYMAIDGVAPRAKMNQQRSRRFRASKEAADKREEIRLMRKKLADEGVPLPPPRAEEEHFDSNCITPGTPFMARLAVALRYYIHERVTNDPAWQQIQVILSDASVPGEGEHKIMDYIRRQRASASHDPNTVHCLCGADADLIMLGLATHEVNFNIIREEFVPNQPRACELCGQYGHELKDCQGLAAKEAGADQADPFKKEKNFIFIRLPVLREYLERELQMPNLPFEYDFERAVDDWVFMCFFVGNDFLPHLPSLEIREGAIDRLIKLYKNMVYNVKGWLTHDGEVNMERVQMIMVELGRAEDEIFRTRQMRDSRQREQQKARRRRERASNHHSYNSRLMAPQARPVQFGGAETRRLAADQRKSEMQRCAEATEKLKSILIPAGNRKRPASEEGPTDTTSESDAATAPPPSKGDDSVVASAPTATGDDAQRESQAWQQVGRNGRPVNNNDGDSDEDDEPADSIKLHEAGWKDRYYGAKFGEEALEEGVEFRHRVAWAYVEGLCWVMRYYYQGCASWDWYFPYHYAPFASDFSTVGGFRPDWGRPTKPFNPLEQLMSVFPAASREHIPAGWRRLMTDEQSPIIHFYPEDFTIDLNGKRFAWQGVALLPFVDEKQLLATLKGVYDTLTSEERQRNSRGPDRLFVGKRHKLFPAAEELFVAGKEAGFDEKARKWVYIDATLTRGMAGEIAWDVDACAPGETYVSLFRNALDFTDVKENACLMVDYRDPQFPEDKIFTANRLEGAVEPTRVLKPGDWDERREGQYRPQIGFSRDVPRAYLPGSSHRQLNAHIDRRGGGGGGYHQQPLIPLSAMSNRPMMPPPMHLRPLSGGGGGGSRGGATYYNSGYSGSWNSNAPQHHRQDNRWQGGSNSRGAPNIPRPPAYTPKWSDFNDNHGGGRADSWRPDGGGGRRGGGPPDPAQIPQPLSFAEMAFGGAPPPQQLYPQPPQSAPYYQQPSSTGQYYSAGDHQAAAYYQGGGYQASWGAPTGGGGSHRSSSGHQGQGQGGSGRGGYQGGDERRRRY